jgi:hypothetical protein
MLIVAGELMLLHEADAKGRRFALGWVLVWSGILATLAANVTFGAQFGIVGALIWGWPAYSFILAAGGMVSIVKRAASREDAPATDIKRAAALANMVRGDVRHDAEPDIQPVAEVDTPASPGGVGAPLPVDIDVDSQADKPEPVEVDKPRPAVRTLKRTPTAADKVTAVLRRDPGLSNVEVAKRAGVSAKTVQRTRPQPASPDGD